MAVNFKIRDFALRVNRDNQTIKRWEEEEYIPKARRDSRQYRVYNEKEMEELVNLVIESDYFRDKKKYPRKKEVINNGEDYCSDE